MAVKTEVGITYYEGLHHPYLAAVFTVFVLSISEYKTVEIVTHACHLNTYFSAELGTVDYSCICFVKI